MNIIILTKISRLKKMQMLWNVINIQGRLNKIFLSRYPYCTQRLKHCNKLSVLINLKITLEQGDIVLHFTNEKYSKWEL